MKFILFIFVFSQTILITRNQKEVSAILLSTSKFWFNYRQGANSLLVYNRLRDNGIKDSNIVVQLPENIACNPRNNEPGFVSCYDGKAYPNLYVNPVIDYRHTDVSVETLLNLIRNRYPNYIPQSKRLNLNMNSRLLIYVNGHGGDGYLKMQDTHVVSTEDFAKALRELYLKELYSEVLAISDSCEAATLFYGIDVPNVFAIGSSTKGQRSLSHGRDEHLNLAKTDKFTFITNEFLTTTYQRNKQSTLDDMMKIYTRQFLEEDFEFINTFEKKNEKNDFFSSVEAQKPKEILLGKLDPLNMDFEEQKFLEEVTNFMEGNQTYEMKLPMNQNIISFWEMQNARVLTIQ